MLPAPTDGMQCSCSPATMYEEKGEFQLTVMEPALPPEQGGLWKLAFEKRKAALTKTALDPARKRRLRPSRAASLSSRVPTAPRCATSRRHRRRWPVAELIVVPAQVQGAKAEGSVCSALIASRDCRWMF